VSRNSRGGRGYIYIHPYILYIYIHKYIYIYICLVANETAERRERPLRHTTTKSEVDALGVRTISPGWFERCCSNQKTPPYHSNLSFVTLRNRRPTLLRAPAYRRPSEASPRRRCGHVSLENSVSRVCGVVERGASHR